MSRRLHEPRHGQLLALPKLEMELIVAAALMVLSIGLSVRIAKGLLTLVLFLMASDIRRPAVVDITSTGEFAHERPKLQYIVPAA